MKAGMQAPLPGAVEHCVELLCQQGCSKVGEYIDALQQDKPVPGVDGLNEDERQALLEELVSIMAVYQCSCDER